MARQLTNAESCRKRRERLKGDKDKFRKDYTGMI